MTPRRRHRMTVAEGNVKTKRMFRLTKEVVRELRDAGVDIHKIDSGDTEEARRALLVCPQSIEKLHQARELLKEVAVAVGRTPEEVIDELTRQVGEATS